MTTITIHSKQAEQANEATWTGEVELQAPADKTTGRLSEIFRLFNRVEEADCERLAALGYELPSLSVGDLIELDGHTWRVAPVGFQLQGGLTEALGGGS
jgi:hypothetical protein